eukprot:CAMPEP_0170343924 /NCGR_PEP_ID=MMETSP0116_2-20130129/73142_1 /TAXON_ID=400756 /ORGANISM="Durinskia baltica, Strain CSIRO CS-38" /LENGTH=312 /DNA_ID=CAMNT_0010597587 /DNA_START=315 /DNA_END=1252 /DNA_ORIENTATION=+
MRLPVAGAATYMVALVLLVLELPSVSAEGSCLEPLDAMLVDADERLEQHFGSQQNGALFGRAPRSSAESRDRRHHGVPHLGHKPRAGVAGDMPGVLPPRAEPLLEDEPEADILLQPVQLGGLVHGVAAIQVWWALIINIIAIVLLFVFYSDGDVVGPGVRNLVVGVITAYIWAHMGWFAVVKKQGCCCCCIVCMSQAPILLLIYGIWLILWGVLTILNAIEWLDLFDEAFLYVICYGSYAIPLLYMGIAMLKIWNNKKSQPQLGDTSAMSSAGGVDPAAPGWRQSRHPPDVPRARPREGQRFGATSGAPPPP